ncbi:hypothetical protein G6L46_10405 [Agrobacterium rhizogenes]|uniref:hypothetical protein n=1 Tax=Rhizobium rhizogenes TaxID=359 RepID=UPI001572A163|nr:hypothetical protein [Rhizobium rhizogenes]NTF87535.1 hypothetical protein [Rhizobium rhizogenes]
MHKGNVKLPDRYVLKQHMENGMERREIAALYNCHPDSVRDALRKAGLIEAKKKQPPIDGPRPAYKPPGNRREIEIRQDRIVFTREVTAGMNGGMTLRRISVPRITSHIAALQDAGRC